MALKRLDPGPAIELYLRRRGRRYDVAASFPIEKCDLPWQLDPDDTSAPFYFELHDLEGLLFRGTGHDPTGATIEFPGGRGRDGGPTLTRKDSEAEEFFFTLLIPDITKARRLLIHSDQLDRVFPVDDHSDFRLEFVNIKNDTPTEEDK